MQVAQVIQVLGVYLYINTSNRLQKVSEMKVDSKSQVVTWQGGCWYMIQHVVYVALLS